MPRRIDRGQMRLFPTSPKELALEIGLDWWAAQKLYDDHWLSFDPETTVIDDDAMEAEFRLLGALVAGGCDPHLLRRLLAGLEKPYCYNIDSIHYDWVAQQWVDRTRYSADPRRAALEAVAELEESGNADALREIEGEAQEAADRLAGADDEVVSEEDAGNPDEERYDFDPAASTVVEAARRLIWKLAHSTLADSAAKRIVVGKMFRILQRLPDVPSDESLSVQLSGPRRKFGHHTIYHWWHIELDGSGYLSITSGGHFHRPETGGDSFTAMTWTVAPGAEPEECSFLESLSIVDDADTYENEVAAMDLSMPGYALSVEDSTLESWIEADEEDGTL